MPTNPIYIAVTIDESFLTPMMVMLRSALENLSRGWTLDVYVIGYKLSEVGRRKVESRLSEFPILFHWEELDLSGRASRWPGLRNEGDITCYYRLFLEEVLPDSVEQILFLDCDLLIEGDLAELWQQPFEGHCIQAVPDSYTSTYHLPRLRQIEFGQQLRFREDSLYFNAGVQLIHLASWREQKIGQQASAFLDSFGPQLAGRDQDALNCVLFARWKRLDLRWNLHEIPNEALHWDGSGASRAEVQRAWDRPGIIHFIGMKPWSSRRRPHRAERWWVVAGRCGVAKVRRDWGFEIWEFLTFDTHTKLDWSIRRRNWKQFVMLTVTRPWAFLTYPLRLLRNVR